MAKTSPEAQKQELMAGLIRARSEVIEAGLALPPAQRDAVFLGVWSTHDLLAHLIGWDHTNRGALGQVQAGCLPPFFVEYDTDWRTYNARLVGQFKRPTFDETLAEVEASHQGLIAALEALPADAFTRDFGVRSPRGRRVTIAMLLEAEASDERKHASQVRAFAGQRAKI